MVEPKWHVIQESYKAYEEALAALVHELIVNGFHETAVQLVEELPKFTDTFFTEIGDKHHGEWR